MEIKLPRKTILPRLGKLPKVTLPEVIIRLPETIEVEWEEMELERVELPPLNPKEFKLIFRKKSE